jgi:hypothetical protein
MALYAPIQNQFLYDTKNQVDRIAALKQKLADAKLDDETRKELELELNSDFSMGADYTDARYANKNANWERMSDIHRRIDAAMGMEGKEAPLFKMRAFLEEQQKNIMDRPGQRQIAGGNLGAKPMNLMTGSTTPISSTGLITGK